MLSGSVFRFSWLGVVVLLSLLYGRHDRTTAIVPHDVERVFADFDSDHGDCAAKLDF